MVIIGFHSKDSLFQDWHKKQVPLAKERLAAFPILNKILNNFDGYENLVYKQSRNMVFVLCCRRPNGLDEEGYPQILKALEGGLKVFDASSWRKEIYNEFVGRLAHFDYEKSETAVSEILTAYLIGIQIGFDKVSLHPKLKNGKNGDVAATLNGRRIFIEITSLTQRKSEEKIREILFELAKYISLKCTPKIYSITAYVDAACLPTDSQGHISKELSVSYLMDWSDRLRLHELAGITGSIDFRRDYSWIGGRKYLADLVESEYEYSLPSELRDIIDKYPEAAQWAKNVEVKSLNLSPITAVFYDSESQGDFVEIHSVEFYPSPSTLAQEKGFHSQLVKKINDKVAGGQYEQGSPVIIMVKEDIAKSMFFDSDFGESRKINSLVEKEIEKSPWISGVIIYTRTILDGRYIENKLADLAVRIRDGELASLDFENEK